MDPLDLKKIIPPEGFECSICMGDSEDDIVVHKEINFDKYIHPVHYGCLKEWVATSATCPSCRGNLRKDYFISEENKKAVLNAIDQENLEVLREMLEKPGLLEIRTEEGSTLLSYAIQERKKSTISFLIQKFPNLASQADSKGWYPLHTASYLGDNETVSLLLELDGCGIDIDAVTVDGKSAIYLAAENSYTKVVEELIDYVEFPPTGTFSAEIGNIIFLKKERAINLAVHTKDTRTLNKVLRSGWLTLAQKEKALALAIIRDDKETVGILIQHGVSIATEVFKRLPLKTKNHIEYILVGEALIKAACRNDEKKVKEFLKRYPLAQSYQDRYGSTPLLESVKRKYSSLASLLLTKDAKVNTFDEMGNTALIIATILKDTKTIEILLKTQADKRHKNKAGKTALAIAKEIGSPEIISLLS